MLIFQFRLNQKYDTMKKLLKNLALAISGILMLSTFFDWWTYKSSASSFSSIGSAYSGSASIDVIGISHPIGILTFILLGVHIYRTYKEKRRQWMSIALVPFLMFLFGVLLSEQSKGVSSNYSGSYGGVSAGASISVSGDVTTVWILSILLSIVLVIVSFFTPKKSLED